MSIFFTTNQFTLCVIKKIIKKSLIISLVDSIFHFYFLVIYCYKEIIKHNTFIDVK